MKHYSFDIPGHWENIKLSDIAIYTTSGNWGKPANRLFNNYITVRVIRAVDFNNWIINKGEFATLRKIDKYTFEEKKIFPNDILFEASGGSPTQPVGRVLYIDNETIERNKAYPLFFSNFFRLIRISQFLNSHYIFHYFKYAQTIDLFRNYQKLSNNLRNFSFSKFENEITIPLPPLQEQKQIAKKLDTELCVLKAQKEKLQKEFKVKYKKYTEESTSDFFKYTTQKNWDRTTIGEIEVFLGSGVTPKGGQNNYLTQGIPFIRSQNVLVNKLNFSNIAYISEQLHNEMSRTHVKSNDVLLNITGASIGRSAIVPENFITGNVNQHVCIIRTNDEVFPKFLSYYLNSCEGQKQILEKQDGVTREGLNYPQIRSLKFYLPVLKKQKEIVKKIDESYKKAEELKSNFEMLITELEKAEADLFNKAFSGKLIKPIPNDTPVNELLEKIKEEKAILEKQRKELQKKHRKMPKQKEPKLDIVEVLKQSKKPMLAVDVWKNTKYNNDIDNFYKVLRDEMLNKKTVKHSDDKTYIELVWK